LFSPISRSNHSLVPSISSVYPNFFIFPFFPKFLPFALPLLFPLFCLCI
jgi:hypothetical protein